MPQRAGVCVVVLLAVSGCAAREATPDEQASTLQTSHATAAADASVPATPRDAGAGCHCATVEITCGSTQGYASSDRRACTIDLTPTMCGQLGYHDGLRVAPEAILGAAPFDFASPAQLYDFCASKHEARHTCDDPDLVSACQTEQNAYAVSASCFSAISAQFCGHKTPPAWCSSVTLYAESQEAGHDFNACLCQSSETCAACSTQCQAGRPATASMCSELAQAYCAVNGK